MRGERQKKRNETKRKDSKPKKKKKERKKEIGAFPANGVATGPWRRQQMNEREIAEATKKLIGITENETQNKIYQKQIKKRRGPKPDHGVLLKTLTNGSIEALTFISSIRCGSKASEAHEVESFARDGGTPKSCHGGEAEGAATSQHPFSLRRRQRQKRKQRRIGEGWSTEKGIRMGVYRCSSWFFVLSVVKQ